jgi:acyl dehydratase
MSGEPLYFDQLALGDVWESEPRLVTADDVRTFADLTGDRNPVHLDPEFARGTPFRRCVAHGLLGVGIAGGLGWTTPPARTVAFLELREWHFRAPIYFGDTVRIRVTVREKQLQGRGRRGTVVWGVTMLNQDGRVVQEGVTATLVEVSKAASEAA